jgi:hypothetical protein
MQLTHLSAQILDLEGGAFDGVKVQVLGIVVEHFLVLRRQPLPRRLDLDPGG